MSLSTLSVTEQAGEQMSLCIACGASNMTPFFRLSDLPVHVGIFYDDAESAKQTPRGNVELAYCHECGHVFNRAFRPDKIDYRPGYEVGFRGTGGKGVTFFNACPSASMIEVVAEIHPAKQGKFVPGSAQRIVAPEYLVNLQPDVIIISNALYEDEIREQAISLGLKSEIHVC